MIEQKKVVTWLAVFLLLGALTFFQLKFWMDYEIKEEIAETQEQLREIAVNRENDMNELAENQDPVEEPLSYRYEEVTSDLHEISVPIYEGFVFDKLYENFEYHLKSENYDGFVFYFESDFSPGPPQDPVITDYEIESEYSQTFKVRQISSSSGILNYVEAKDDPSFYVSVVFGDDNVEEQKELMRLIFERLKYSKRVL